MQSECQDAQHEFDFQASLEGYRVERLGRFVGGRDYQYAEQLKVH